MLTNCSTYKSDSDYDADAVHGTYGNNILLLATAILYLPHCLKLPTSKQSLMHSPKDRIEFIWFTVNYFREVTYYQEAIISTTKENRIS